MTTFVDPKEILAKVRAKNAARQAENNSDGREEPPWPNGPEDYGSNDGNAENAHGTVESGTQQPLFDPWAQYVVPDFPFDVLPPVARDFVAAQGVVVGCDPSALAMAVLAAFSGALDHRFSLKMLRHGQWWEHPRLWVLLVGDPSAKKTPIINAATRPLEQHERHLRERAEADWKQYLESGGNPKDERPKPPRFVVFDSTIEKLGDILSRTERGLLVKRDEFSGWLGSMEKYSNTARGAGADRGFWLQAFDGGPFTVDRISRGELHIQNLSVSLVGGIQPARLAEIHGLTSDGCCSASCP